MKKEDNLKFLNMPIKDLLSTNISTKYKTKDEDSNKKEIENLLNKEKDNEIIGFIFNLTLRDWIDIFTYKKEIIDFGIYESKMRKEIEDNFERVDKLLDEIYNSNLKSNDINYFSKFACLIYNYERWFFIKQSRQKKPLTNK